MHKQLLLFHNAISAYFAGNQQQLEETLKQFNIKLRPLGADKPSWLEEQWDPAAFCSATYTFPVEPPQLTEDHNRGACAVTGGWGYKELLRWYEVTGYQGLIGTLSGQFYEHSRGFLCLSSSQLPFSNLTFVLCSHTHLLPSPFSLLQWYFAAQACVSHCTPGQSCSCNFMQSS